MLVVKGATEESPAESPSMKKPREGALWFLNNLWDECNAAKVSKKLEQRISKEAIELKLQNLY